MSPVSGKLVATATVGALLLVFAVAACGGDDDGTVTETETVTEQTEAPEPVTPEAGATTEAAPGGGIPEAEAIAVAQNSASESLPPTFTVLPEDWAASCTPTDSTWECELNAGPCSGSVAVKSAAGEVVGRPNVGCIAD